MRRSFLNKYMNILRHTCPLYMYELVLPIIIAMNPYRPTIKDLQLLRRRVVYLSEVSRKRAMRERAICMSGEIDMHND